MKNRTAESDGSGELRITISLEYPGIKPMVFIWHTAIIPPFEYGCETRAKILRDFLLKNPALLEKTPHQPEDFVVEEVDTVTPVFEIWHLGS